MICYPVLYEQSLKLFVYASFVRRLGAPYRFAVFATSSILEQKIHCFRVVRYNIAALQGVAWGWGHWGLLRSLDLFGF